MKKNILIFSTVLMICSLTACSQSQNDVAINGKEIACNKTVAFESSFLNAMDKQADSDFYYNVAPRFNTTITKENLHNAKTIIDILPKGATEAMKKYENVSVAVLKDGKEISEIGRNEVLNAAQIKLLQSTDYSTNIHISADCKTKNQSGKLERYDLVYYMTIVPEVAAAPENGQDVLLDYLKKNSTTERMGIEKNRLKPGKISFFITEDGVVANVNLNSTSGYDALDEKLLDLIAHMSQNWIPATNSKGEKVTQEFICFFGLEGC